MSSIPPNQSSSPEPAPELLSDSIEGGFYKKVEKETREVKGELPTPLYGELLRSSGTVSAPPPGFTHYENIRDKSNENEDVGIVSNINRGHLEQVSGTTVVVSRGDVGRRSSSFADLAAALGEGLAESMDDSCKDQKWGILQPSSRYAMDVQKVNSTFSSTHLPPQSKNEHNNLTLSQKRSDTVGLVSTTMNNYQRQGRHSASRLIGNFNDDKINLYSGSGILLNSRTNTVSNHNHSSDLDLTALKGAHGVPKGGLIGTSMASNRLYQTRSNDPQVSNDIPRIDVTIDKPQEKLSDSDQRHYHGLIQERSESLTPSSLYQAASHVNQPEGNSFPNALNASAIYNEQSDRIIDTFHSHSRQQLSGSNETNNTNFLKIEFEESSGRASAPPNLYDSSRSQYAIHQNRLNLQRLATTPELLTPNQLILESKSTSSSPKQDPASHHIPISRSSNSSSSEQIASVEMELAPFIHDAKKSAQNSQLSMKPSRGLVIIGLSNMLLAGKISILELRTTCEAFGAIETFRTDFATTKGVIFLSFYDLRSGQHAALVLGSYLDRFVAGDQLAPHGNLRNDFNIKVKYCVPFHSSAKKDDSLILLSNLPQDTDEDSLALTMESYGAVKAIHYQMSSNDQNHGDLINDYESESNDDGENQSYTVEFFDIQDAKHALMELINGQPFGKEVKIQRGMTNPSTRRKSVKLLTLLGRWRQGQSTNDRPSSFTPPITTTPPPLSSTVHSSVEHLSFHSNGHEVSATSSASSSTSPMPVAPTPNSLFSLLPQGIPTQSQNSSAANHQISRFPSQHLRPAAAPQTQYLVSPDGQYSYVMVNPPIVANHPDRANQCGQAIQVQHVLNSDNHHYANSTIVHNHAVAHHPPNQHPVTQYWTTTTAPSHHHPHHQTTHLVIPPGVTTNPPYVDSRLVTNSGLHLYSNIAPMTHADSDTNKGASQTRRNSSGKKNTSHSNKSRQKDESSDENMHLTLDIESVKSGRCTKSSLMVRNIPNKYTQQMLLAEFTEFGYGSNKIDFFYLPIDFKNRCNRGYAFINFVNYKDIVSFHEQYNNKQWRVFNSDKVCAITYARIQGKAAMLKRFEHSALLDKNDEYRPLVFVSHGVNKGKRENFPSTSSNDDESEAA